MTMNLRHVSRNAIAMILISACSNTIAAHWQPTLSTDLTAQPPKWDWQLKVPVQLNSDSSIEIYDIDMFDNESTGAVGLLQSFGKKVICYVDVGSWEDFRDDKDDFPDSILGNVYHGFPDERWLDIRDVNPAKSNTGTALADILAARFDRAMQMGCDAVEPDNMDVYDETAHDPSGFPLSYEDQMYFNLWVSQEVRSRGMAVGLKNNINQAQDPRTIEAFDFVVSEQCVQYNECGYYSGFIDAGKPVFLAEYELEPETFCPVAKANRISATGKRENLDTYRTNCDSYYDSEAQPPEPNPVPPSQNLLINGSFEDTLSGWNSCGDASALSLSSNAYQGTSALAFQGGSGCLYQEVPVTDDQQYALSCQVKSPGILWSIIELSYLDAQYNKLSTTTKQIVASASTYSPYTLSNSAVEGSSYALVLLYSEDQTLIDNCVLSPVQEPETPPDTAPPVVSMDQIDPSPTGVVTITGDSTDDVAIDRNKLLIKNNTTGQYWSGAAWIDTWRWFTPDGTNNWSYTISLNDGKYTTTAWTWDTANNIGNIVHQKFSVGSADTTAPVVSFDTIDSPSTGVVTVSGESSDNVAIDRNKLLIKNNTTGQYWSGSAWIDSWRWFTPDGTNDWSYSITLDAGKYTTIAWTWDTANNLGNIAHQKFTVGVSETTAPTVSFDPINEATDGVVTVSGISSDDVAIDRNRLLIQDLTTGQYWDGSVWSDTWRWFTPNGVNNWSYTITLSTGNYKAIAWTWDTSENLGNIAQQSFTVQ